MIILFHNKLQNNNILILQILLFKNFPSSKVFPYQLYYYSEVQLFPFISVFRTMIGNLMTNEFVCIGQC